MLAAFLHIFIDSLPHIDFLYQIKITFLNKWWLKQGVFALAYLAILAFSQSKRFILVKLSAILGGIYPAMEKLLYFENILPERWVVSKIMTLLPGDIISTGTPSGIDRVKPGDRVEVCIEKVGGLVNYAGKE